MCVVAFAKCLYLGLNSSETRPLGVIEYLQCVICCSLINAASCRASRATKYRRPLPDLCLSLGASDPFPVTLVTVEELCEMDAGDLAILASRCYFHMTVAGTLSIEVQFNRCIMLIKLALVEEKMGRYFII